MNPEIDPRQNLMATIIANRRMMNAIYEAMDTIDWTKVSRQDVFEPMLNRISESILDDTNDLLSGYFLKKAWAEVNLGLIEQGRRKVNGPVIGWTPIVVPQFVSFAPLDDGNMAAWSDLRNGKLPSINTGLKLGKD